MKIPNDILEKSKDFETDSTGVEKIRHEYAEFLLNNVLTEHRQKVAAIVLNKENKFLLVQLHIYRETDWNLPGGGVDEGEDPEEALLRELKEELNTDKFTILERSPIERHYDFGTGAILHGLKIGKIKYKGQKQSQYILKFIGEDADIKIQDEELKAFKWVDYKDLKTHLNFDNQWENLQEVVSKSSLEL